MNKLIKNKKLVSVQWSFRPTFTFFYHEKEGKHVSKSGKWRQYSPAVNIFFVPNSQPVFHGSLCWPHMSVGHWGTHTQSFSNNKLTQFIPDSTKVSKTAWTLAKKKNWILTTKEAKTYHIESRGQHNLAQIMAATTVTRCKDFKYIKPLGLYYSFWISIANPNCLKSMLRPKQNLWTWKKIPKIN